MGGTQWGGSRGAAPGALVSPLGGGGTLLSTLIPAQAATARPATPVPPPPTAALAGTWVNTNNGTKNVADIVVATSRGGIAVDGVGACAPTLCEVRTIPGTVSLTTLSAPIRTSIATQF